MQPQEIDPIIQSYMDKHLTHQTHNSERKAFRACRRRWNWAYRDMIAPQVTAMPLEFGVAFHAAMEIFYDPRMWTQDLEVRTDLALVMFRQTSEKQLKNYKKLNPDPDLEILNSYRDHRDLGLQMLRYYCQTISPIYDRMWTPLRVEIEFEVPLKDPQGAQLWCKCSVCKRRWMRAVEAMPSPDGDILRSNWHGLPVTYGGRLDALFQDNHGRLWIADWKTTSRLLDEDAEASFLQLDDQVVSYMWALQQCGINCTGFVYVEIKKTFPSPPEPMKRRHEGRLFSVDRNKLTTAEMFERTVIREDRDAWDMGLYDRYISWLKTEGPKFTQRHQIHKNQNEIEEAGRAIVSEVMDMIDNPRVYPQPGRFSCNWCLFKQPCIGVNMGEDYQYTLDTMFTKFDKYYWEIKTDDRSTE